ncbi:hypothetical protein HMPREF9176_0075 [Streptococcus downei F0415]|nr:hypothetical protein HMPREF9176_0075 [Streptococcus downei F0415]
MGVRQKGFDSCQNLRHLTPFYFKVSAKTVHRTVLLPQQG